MEYVSGVHTVHHLQVDINGVVVDLMVSCRSWCKVVNISSQSVEVFEGHSMCSFRVPLN